MHFRSWEKSLLVLLLVVSIFNLVSIEKVFAKEDKKVILYVPQDDRPISSEQTADVIRSMGYTVKMPPKSMLGDRDKNGRPEEINKWLMENGGKDKVAVISSDAMVYGSLVSSRKHHIPKELLLKRVNNISEIHEAHPKMPIYMFTSIMRTPRDGASSGTEEPEYYVKYGKAIANYTKIDNADTSGLNESYQVSLREEVPEAALNDWLSRRQVNVQVSKRLINLVHNGDVEYLAIGRDDNAKFSQTHRESNQLKEYAQSLGLNNSKVQVLTGLDEVGLLVLTRVVNELENNTPHIYVQYAMGYGGATIPTYADEPIDEAINEQINTVDGIRTYDANKADLVMLINTNRSGWTYDANTPVNTLQLRYNSVDFINKVKNFVDEGYPVTIGDIAFANGSDNALMNQLYQLGLLDDLCGYAGWNTATNSTGFALGMGIVGEQISQEKRNKLLLTRYLDDWVYQANIRQNINSYLNLLPGKGDYLSIGETKLPYIEEYGTKLMRAFAKEKLNDFAQAETVFINMPWDRIFEANISLGVSQYDEGLLKKHMKR